MKTVRYVAIALGAVFALIFVLNAFGLEMFKYFAPRVEEAKREVFLQSKERVGGIISELDKMRLEHAKLTNQPDVRAAMEGRALRLVANLDRDNLPTDLRQWIVSIERQ